MSVVTLEAHNRVREIRIQRRLSLGQLSLLVGASPQSLQHLETRGKRRPYRIDVQKLASALETTVDDLFPTVAA